ncbi:MAG: PLP-dependent aspartate aminotransferase family protein [Chloroflexota bacterium]|nr:PLP-dependent aspartate aminotransferase family protein [Chloroflexota bacterium]
MLPSSNHDAADPTPAPARGLSTRAVHAGERPARPDFTPTTMPIYPATAYIYDEATIQDAVFGNERPGYVYSRYGNPTNRALEEAVADLEGTESALAYGSGMAAVHAAILSQVQAGSRIVAARDCYGATSAVLNNVFATLGVTTTFVDILDLDRLEAVVAEVKPRLITCETISNPLVRVTNIAAVVEIGRRHRAKVMVDNTFATPVLVNPSRFGAHLVVHSATKYLGGHGDVTGGVIAAAEEVVAELHELNKLTGAVLGPFEAWLTLRGIKTLPLRFRRQCASAAIVAGWLDSHPGVARVYYPGLTELGAATAQFNGPERGAMLSFDLKDAGKPEAFQFMEALKLCLPATTLGDVYSLVLYPPISSHRALTAEQRAEIGIHDGLIRLSVGIEDVEDIIADLEHALAAVAAGSRSRPVATVMA